MATKRFGDRLVPTSLTVRSRLKSLLTDSRQIFRNFAGRVVDRRLSLLVLHDLDGWALDHVFDLWFRDCRPFRIVRLNWNRIATSRAFLGHRIVVFGYLDIYLRFNYRPANSVVIIHDPCELFPQVPEWRHIPPNPDRLEVLRSLRAVIVISEELEEILLKHGIRAHRIPTMSRLPLRSEADLTTPETTAISIFKDHPRKNAEMLRRLAERGNATGKWRLVLHENPNFSDTAYMDLIDRTPIYVCASWQEGGPLPAMDVMSRGGVVLSTKVGQLREIIKDGESGYFCESQVEFEDKLTWIFQNQQARERMRRKSLLGYETCRSSSSIRNTVQRVFQQILHNQ